MSGATVDAIPLSKGWFHFDRPNVSYALLATVGTALARTYALSAEHKVLDPANALLFPLFILRDKLDDELYKRTERRYLGDIACGVGAFVVARSYTENMSSNNATKYAALAAAVSVLARYALEDNNLLKI